jgi:hypothetical protein
MEVERLDALGFHLAAKADRRQADGQVCDVVAAIVVGNISLDVLICVDVYVLLRGLERMGCSAG